MIIENMYYVIRTKECNPMKFIGNESIPEIRYTEYIDQAQKFIYKTAADYYIKDFATIWHINPTDLESMKVVRTYQF